jgi:hypothetical protein
VHRWCTRQAATRASLWARLVDSSRCASACAGEAGHPKLGRSQGLARKPPLNLNVLRADIAEVVGFVFVQSGTSRVWHPLGRGPDGVDVICIGGRKPEDGDTERFEDFWT